MFFRPRLDINFFFFKARLHGEPERQFSSIIGWKALKESVELFGETSPATILKPDLSSGIDPDDYFSSIPYGNYCREFFFFFNPF